MVTIPNDEDDHAYDEELVTVTYDSGEGGYPDQGWYYSLGVDDPPYGGFAEWFDPHGPFDTREEATRAGKIDLPSFLAILAEDAKGVAIE